MSTKSINGRYGDFGGCYLPELLMPPIIALRTAWDHYQNDVHFLAEWEALLKNYAGRSTPLTEVKNFSEAIKGPRIFLKREDLLHTGAHKINNALGQCLLAKKMGKTRVIAETGAGQHGVATAAACAYLQLPCVIYMGETDIKRQEINVTRMKLFGAEVRSVKQGSATLKDAVNEALRDWSEHFTNTHYCLGSALGPDPYPEMVGFFQSVIGNEAKAQCQAATSALPDLCIAAVGGGSNAIGLFSAFLDEQSVALVGVEAGGTSQQLGMHAARFLQSQPGVLHGCLTYVLQDQAGQIADTHSISAGLDYPAVGPQHAALFQNQRAQYVHVSDQEAIAAFLLLSRTEGILPALESAHALAYAMCCAKNFTSEQIILINLSGRGDKDLAQLMAQGVI